MIIKPYDQSHIHDAVDDLQAAIAANPKRKQALEKQIKILRAGAKAERQAAHHIDDQLSETKNWAVIHNLRIEVNGAGHQFDHVLVNRELQAYVVETKNATGGFRINENGEWQRISHFNGRSTEYGMESPLAQCERHQRGLAKFLEEQDLMPRRLGIRIKPVVKYLVVVNKEALLERPKSFDTSRVVKMDDFWNVIQADFKKEENSIAGGFGVFGTISRLVSKETLREFAEAIAACDKPLVKDRVARNVAQGQEESDDLEEAVTAVETGITPKTDVGAAVAIETVVATRPAPECAIGGAHCKACESTNLEIRHGKFGYYWKCLDCGENTKIVLPGAGKLRKDGSRFFYVDPDGKEVLFYVNKAL